MAFRKVGGERKYFKYNDCTKGQVLVENGEYLGTEEGKFGIQHLFRETDGVTTVLNSANHLNYHMDKNVCIGDRVKVVFDGKIVLTKGDMKGKECNQFEVYVDSETEPAKTPALAKASAPKDTAADISL